MEWGHRQISTELSQRIPRQAQKVILVFGAFFLFLLFLPHNPPPQRPLAIQTRPTAIRFPQKIWQLWKVNSFAISDDERRRVRPWAELNPGHRYELLSDTNEEDYVATAYGPEGFNRTDIVDWYRSVKDRIVRADVLRYLIMYAEGGVYADIDVEALQPISRWVPEHYNVKDVDMVIGIEVDQPDFAHHPILGPRSMTFCQWTFMSKPRHQVMLKLVEHIMTWLAKVAEERGSTVSNVKLDFTDIISGTGPTAFGRAMLEYMSQEAGHTVTWDTFHNIVESKLVSGILVLPVEAYAAGQGHSDSGTHSTRRALVKHHYHASKWPDSHPMFTHPMYGLVESCNWKKDCVKKWDDNVAAWEKLSKEEQTVLLEEKKEEDRKKKEEQEEDDRKAEETRKEEDRKAEKKKAEETRKEAMRKEEAARKEEARKQESQDQQSKTEGPRKKETIQGAEGKS